MSELPLASLDFDFSPGRKIEYQPAIGQSAYQSLLDFVGLYTTNDSH